MSERIAFVKTGWSEDYTGGPVRGRHAHIKEYLEAHEALNFLPDARGKYYAYIPPIGGDHSPPQPRVVSGWLIVFVAAYRGYGPLTVVGWYQNAKFHSSYEPRPDSESATTPHTPNGSPYTYCISSPKAVLLDLTQRTTRISGAHFRRTPIVYVRGHDSAEPWRDELAAVAESLLAPPPSVQAVEKAPKIVFPDAAHRKKVEDAAVSHVCEHFERKGYNVDKVQSLNLGYDLAVNRGKDLLRVEVKGTASHEPHFFLTRNEWNHSTHTHWRLALVTDALTRPLLTILTTAQMNQRFIFEPLAYYAHRKP